MTAAELFADLLASGIDLQCTADGESLSVPANALTSEQRALVVLHKSELIGLVKQLRRVTVQLHQVAMHVCDHWNDSPSAREQMRQDCLSTPPHLRADLLAHLQQAYPAYVLGQSNTKH